MARICTPTHVDTALVLLIRYGLTVNDARLAMWSKESVKDIRQYTDQWSQRSKVLTRKERGIDPHSYNSVDRYTRGWMLYAMLYDQNSEVDMPLTETQRTRFREVVTKALGIQQLTGDPRWHAFMERYGRKAKVGEIVSKQQVEALLGNLQRN